MLLGDEFMRLVTPHVFCVIAIFSAGFSLTRIFAKTLPGLLHRIRLLALSTPFCKPVGYYPQGAVLYAHKGLDARHKSWHWSKWGECVGLQHYARFGMNDWAG
ncbi:hypothetical protein Trydic_g3931 [Trypoxylus dichotomus]